MQKSKKRRLGLFFRDTGLQELPLRMIHARELPPEDDAGLQALAVSLSRFGMLHPLTVRKRAGGYELICGRRRLAAARRCGFRTAPCHVVAAGDADCLALRLAEDQRRRTSFLQTATLLRELVYTYGWSVEEAALCAGLPENEAVEKLHLLRLPGPVLETLERSGLTERHAMALLRIGDEKLREAALGEMVRLKQSPEAAERFVAELIGVPAEQRERGGRTTFVLRDVRLFLNSVSRGLDMMRSGGVAAECLREDADNCIKLTIRIPERISNS